MVFFPYIFGLTELLGHLTGHCDCHKLCTSHSLSSVINGSTESQNRGYLTFQCKIDFYVTEGTQKSQVVKHK